MTEPTLVALARRLDALRREPLPPAVTHEVGRRLLDSIGCMVAGADGREVLAARGAALAAARGDEATIVGAPDRTSAEWATIVNCAALRHLDFMDGHYGAYPCHAGFVIPPILAVAESRDSSGLDVARAVVAGYEVNIRLQQAIGDPDIAEHGWAGSSHLSIAAAAAVCLLGPGDASTIADAMAIAATHGPTLNRASAGQMSPSKAHVDGLVAAAALLAASIAEAGVGGPLDILDAPDGYGAIVGHRVDGELLGAPIERHRILDVYTKRYNAVKAAQTAAAAVLAIRARLRPDAWARIASIEVAIPGADHRRQMQDDEARLRPASRDAANHSVRWCVAAAFVDGDLGPPQFDARHLVDERIRSLAGRIQLRHEPAFDADWPSTNPARVVVETDGGERHEEVVRYAPGHPANPLDDGQLVAKFRTLTGPLLDPAASDRIVAMATGIAGLSGIRPLLAALRPIADNLAVSPRAD